MFSKHPTPLTEAIAFRRGSTSLLIRPCPWYHGTATPTAGRNRKSTNRRAKVAPVLGKPSAEITLEVCLKLHRRKTCFSAFLWSLQVFLLAGKGPLDWLLNYHHNMNALKAGSQHQPCKWVLSASSNFGKPHFSQWTPKIQRRSAWWSFDDGGSDDQDPIYWAWTINISYI